MTDNSAITLTSNSAEESRYDDGGPLLIPALIFLIVACVCGQTCFLIYIQYPDLFFIKDPTVDETSSLQDEHNEAPNNKNSIDFFNINNTSCSSVVPTNITHPPTMIRISRRNSM
jgi:hypothetical protein